jgi:SAM-dependent methyltransferase
MLGLPGEFRLNRCRCCGLIYLSPRPRDLEPYYGGGYVSHRQGAASSPLAQLRAALQRHSMVAYARRHSARKQGRALDVGCGPGVFLAALRGAGWDVWGVEPGAQAAAAARRALGPQIFHGTLDGAELPQRAFDLVTMWDVIEHLPDPGATLRKLGELLAPGGVLLIQTPRWGCPESRLFGAVWSGLDCPRHLAVFSGGTLGRLLGQNDFHWWPIPALSSGFQSWALSLRYAAARRWGSAAGARAYRLFASPPVRLASWPLIAAHDQGAYPAQLAVAATRKGEQEGGVLS